MVSMLCGITDAPGYQIWEIALPFHGICPNYSFKITYHLSLRIDRVLPNGTRWMCTQDVIWRFTWFCPDVLYCCYVARLTASSRIFET